MTKPLLVDASSLSVNSSGVATGNIELVLGEVSFPAPGWNDFIVVILEAWVSALVRLIRKTSTAERVHFMEGPYAVDMSRLDIATIRLRALERPNQQRLVIDTPALSMMKNATFAATDVLLACRSCGHRSDDVARLQGAAEALQNELRNLTN